MAKDVSESFEIIGQRITETPVVFSISNFKDKLKSVARPNLFAVRIRALPQVMKDLQYSESDLSDMEFRCERAEIPGRSIATVDEIGVGSAIKLPYDMTYNDMQLTFICSEDMYERKFFENWMSQIVGSHGDEGLGGLVRYYDEFATASEIEIIQANSSGQTLTSYILYDVYPIQISPMTLAWEETNTYQRFNVTLTYRYHKMFF